MITLIAIFGVSVSTAEAQDSTQNCSALEGEYKQVLKSAGNEHMKNNPRMKMAADARVSLILIDKVEKSACSEVKSLLKNQGFTKSLIHRVLNQNNLPLPTLPTTLKQEPQPSTQSYALSKLDIAGIMAGHSYSEAKIILNDRNYSPFGCADRGYISPRHSSVFRTYSFEQKMKRHRDGLYIDRSNYKGIERACFKNVSTEEHIELMFRQFPGESKVIDVTYKNFDKQVTPIAFKSRVTTKYGSPSRTDGFGKMFFSASNDGDVLGVRPEIKEITLSSQRIANESTSLIQAKKQEITNELNARTDVDTTF